MIPIGMVEGVDLLTGGLSTVYGADAVAGVVNVRMKKDFEGINFTFNTDLPAETGGEIYQASLVGGVGSDTGNITFGMEYSRQERVRTGDRDFSSCLRRGTSGIGQTLSGQRILNCRSDFPDNWMTTLGFDAFASGELAAADGSDVNPVDGTRLIYTPGSSNIVWGPNGTTPGAAVTNYSLFSALPQTTSPTLARFPHTGVDDTDTRPFFLDRFRYDPSVNDQLDRADADLWRPYERFSLVMNGYLDLGWGNNEEAYFEGYYFNRRNEVIGAREQIFPGVPGMIPLVDDTNTPILDANGAQQMVSNPMNPFSFDVNPVLTMDDITQNFSTELQQIRLVGGITGDMPFSDRWSYDVSLAYDRSTGFVAQKVLLENNLFFATQNLGAVADPNTGLPNGQVVCDPRLPAPGGLITATPCVPFDIFNMSVVGDGVTNSGRFSTRAEHDYLMGNRTNRTVTELSMFEAFVTGDLFDLPWNGETVATAFGVQAREDSIDSQNSAIGVQGMIAAENPLQEGETRGSRTTFDVYGEVSAPLIVDAALAELVQLDLAVRYTDDENFGDKTVYKIGGLWRLNETFAFNMSYNTSFRAPNLREQFLADQAGALPGGSDPCTQPNFILLEPGPVRDRLLANCIQSGADVTQLGTAFTVAIPTSVGGAAGLNPETSESLTATLTFNQPWTDRFDFDMALTYFDIQIEDTVRSLDPGTIVARCFFDQPGLASPFCERVRRDRPNATPLNNFISFVRAGFVNTGEETAKGIDFTTRLNWDFDAVNVNWSTATTFMQERITQEFPPSEDDPNGSAIVDNIGRIGNPEWTFQSTVGVAFGNFDVVLQSRYWSDTEFAQGLANPIITDVDGLCLQGCPVGADPNEVFAEDGFIDYGYADSSQIPLSVGPTRPVTAAEGQWIHDLGATYNFETASITVGVNNLLDEKPPLISQEAGPNRNNAVASARYDMIGQSYFVNFVKNF
jgi:iron complex outermembrane receptor protein